MPEVARIDLLRRGSSRRALPFFPSALSVGLSLAAITTMGLVPKAQEPIFTDSERMEIVKFWSEPGRYAYAPLEDPKGSWKVRLTPEGSTWLWNYNKRRGLGKTPPGTVPPPLTAVQQAWERYIDAKVAYDRYIASTDAARENGQPEPIPVPSPGACPADLAEFIGEPPPFANCVHPLVHNIRFDDDQFSYTDNVDMRPRFAYYRFSEGIQSGGTAMRKMSPEEVSGLLRDAGITESEARVFRAVSLLEGGFDAVNTYDTGFVSVGFIQFAALSEGGHSLGKTLLQMKRENPEAFRDDFHRYGIDVDDRGILNVVEPRGGEVATGPWANNAIIQDKRLIAVFQRAGRRKPFRIAQLRAAKAMYYPADDQITLKLGSRTLTGKVREAIHSEAGMAILMDRKVNTGHFGPFTERLAQIANARNLKSFGELAKYERDVLDGLSYRFQALTARDLSQPQR